MKLLVVSDNDDSVLLIATALHHVHCGVHTQPLVVRQLEVSKHLCRHGVPLQRCSGRTCLLPCASAWVIVDWIEEAVTRHE